MSLDVIAFCFKVFLHLFERLRQVIVYGDLADMERLGYLAVLQPLLVAQAENLLREWGKLSVDVLVEGVELFLLFWLLGSLLLEWSQFHLHGLFPLLVCQQIDACVPTD